MSSHDNTGVGDPMLARLLRHRTGLQAGGFHPEHEVLATYHTRSGGRPFAICRHGLLLDPSGEPRFVSFAEIEDAGYYNRDMVERAKEAKASGVSQPLSIRLRDGETIDLPVEVQEDGMPDLLTIAGFLQQWSTIQRAEERRNRPGA